jgi:16S rRNA (adenine1518-N6/adenine1519-N6)-dimethyltransferase
MVVAGKVGPNDYVLEIGPGQGTLTEVLLSSGANIMAVELDKKLFEILGQNYKNNQKLHLLNQDIIKFNLNDLPSGYKIVANIPYYLTSGLIRTLSEAENPPSIAVLLVQKEVAERVAAKPGEMSVLGVTAQMYFETSLGMIVKAKFFTPPPKVDSQILILKRRQMPLFGAQDPQELFRVVKAGFSERRKKLRSSLSGGLHLTKQQADKMLGTAHINSDLRAQNLSLEEWLTLAKVFKELSSN